MIYLQLLWYCTKQVLFFPKHNGTSQIEHFQFVRVSLSFVLQSVHLLLVDLVGWCADCSILIDGETVGFPFLILTGDGDDGSTVIRRFCTNVFDTNSLEMSRLNCFNDIFSVHSSL